MGMDYKNPQEYATESRAFYRGLIVESLWALSLVAFILLCIYAGLPTNAVIK